MVLGLKISGKISSHITHGKIKYNLNLRAVHW